MELATKSKRRYEYDFFGVEQKTLYEIWSTMNRVISARVDLP